MASSKSYNMDRNHGDVIPIFGPQVQWGLQVQEVYRVHVDTRVTPDQRVMQQVQQVTQDLKDSRYIGSKRLSR